MTNKLIPATVIITAIALCAAATGWSDTSPQIQLEVTAQVEVVIVDDEGSHLKKLMPTEKVLPGTEIICTVIYHNPTDQTAEHVVITNPIPEQIRYQNQSVFGEKARVTFSVDNGQSFNLPQNLYLTDATGRPVPAKPDDYTHIRWKLQDPLPPQASGQVGFRAVMQ